MRQILHRNVWQRLPRDKRRSLLFSISRMMAPKPTPNARPNTPIIVAGVLRSASGLGRAARLCHDALKASGLPVYGIDLTNSLMQNADVADFSFEEGSRITGPATLLLHTNSPLVPLAMMILGRKFVRNKYVVGCWSWELEATPPDWLRGVGLVHEVWVPSRFTENAVRPILNGIPTRVVPHPVGLEVVRRPVRNGAGRPFTVLTIFDMASSFERKNPLATIRAFEQAFGDDPQTKLIIKSSNSARYRDGYLQLQTEIGQSPNISFIDRIMSETEIDDLYAEADVLISLHRSEGFGLTMAEAMLRGIPVVATNWSSNAEFMSEQDSVPIGFSLVPTADPQGTYDCGMSWAAANVTEAANALRTLRDNPALRNTLGENAARQSSQRFSPQLFAETARTLLRC